MVPVLELRRSSSRVIGEDEDPWASSKASSSTSARRRSACPSPDRLGTGASSRTSSTRRSSRSRALAAWIAASRSVTRGCPLGNVIPDWNHFNYLRQGRRRPSTACTPPTTSPEFTGRVCPAPCEEACVLNINNDAGHHQARSRSRPPTSAFAQGLDQAAAAERQVRQEGGRGGLRARRASAAAQQLARAGHDGARCSSAPTASAACCATASPTSRWRST